MENMHDQKSDEHKKESHSGGLQMDRKHMLHMHYQQTLWIYWTIIILGEWMVVSPLTVHYGKPLSGSFA